MASKEHDYDWLVIGSGFGGSVSALRLAEKGYRVAVLECGRRSHQRVRALIEAHGIACDYRANGSLRLTRTEEEAEDIRASLAALKSDGFPMLELPLSHAVPPRIKGNSVLYISANHNKRMIELDVPRSCA